VPRMNRRGFARGTGGSTQRARELASQGYSTRTRGSGLAPTLNALGYQTNAGQAALRHRRSTVPKKSTTPGSRRPIPIRSRGRKKYGAGTSKKVTTRKGARLARTSARKKTARAKRYQSRRGIV
jgi:hypothetical protein